MMDSLATYIESLINANAQNSDAQTYAGNVKVTVEKEKIRVIFSSPTSFKLDKTLYFELYDVMNVPLFPVVTLLPQDSMIVEAYNATNIARQRCFVYPYRVGVPTRKVYRNETEFVQNVKANGYELMTGLKLNMKDVTSIAIASTSGGGKSYLIQQLLQYFVLANYETVVVDGKKDRPAKFAQANGIELYVNGSDESDDNLLMNVNRMLERVNNTITKRQNQLFNDTVTEADLRPIVLVFDEIGALTALASKNVKEAFFKLLTRVMTLGRQSRVHVVVSSQRLDANTLPTICKEQCNVLIQLGSLTSNNLQYLFPDYKELDVLVPLDTVGNKGRGLISVNNQMHTFLVPTIGGAAA